MTVFIDYIFIENIIYNFVIVLQTAILARISIKKVRLLGASALGSLYVCMLVIFQLDFLNYFWCKLLLSFVLVYIAYNPEEISKYFKLIGIYYLATIVNLGTCIFVSQMIINDNQSGVITKIITYSVSLVLSYIYTNQFWKIYKNVIRKNVLIQNVVLEINKKRYVYKGFLDTGNTVKSYELGLPVIFAEYLDYEQKEIIDSLPKYNVGVSTISKQSQEQAVLVKNAVVDSTIVDVAVVFVNNKLTRNNKYNLILNYELFEDKLGGIKI